MKLFAHRVDMGLKDNAKLFLKLGEWEIYIPSSNGF